MNTEFPYREAIVLNGMSLGRVEESSLRKTGEKTLVGKKEDLEVIDL